jgi:hypothetical protein
VLGHGRWPTKIAAYVKWFPLVASLRQAVRDNEHRLGVDSHAGMAAQDFDILNVIVVAALQAGPPVADAIELAVDRSCRNRWRLLQFPVFAQELLRLGFVVRFFASSRA